MKTSVLALILLLSCTVAAKQPHTPRLKAELDSIECHFSPQGNQPPCTIRIHLTPEKGLRIAPSKRTDAPHAPLQCIDGEGNLLLGIFREWEYCYDESDDCYTAVYDYFTTPKGNSITVHTHIPVPVAQAQDKSQLVPFSPSQHQELEVAGHRLSIAPVESTPEAKHAHQIMFVITYDHPGTQKHIHLCTADGAPLQYRYRIWDAQKSGVHATTRVSYIVPTDKKNLKLALSPAPTTSIELAPIQFHATIGSLEETHTPASSPSVK